MAKPQQRILLAEDDDIFRSTLKAVLEQCSYSVTEATNGKIAQDIFGAQEFDAVITDIRMPEVTGIQLLQWIKKTKQTPVILMTGFAELVETKQAYELGASGFIAKPFQRHELLLSLQQCLGDYETEQLKETLDEDYCKVSIDDFISGHEIPYDIHIKLGENKYIKVAHRGQDISMERIRAYKSKNVRHLFLKKEDFAKYVQINLIIVKRIGDNANIDRDKKKNFIKHTGEVLMEKVYVNGIDKDSYESSKAFVEASASLMTDDDDTFNLLQMLNNHSDYLYAHSLGVSAYSVMLAKEMRWRAPPTVFKVAMGGLLHDIGKKEISRDLLDRPRKDLSLDEVKVYQSHPTRGLEILNKIPAVSSDVLQVVMQHHEDCIGQGFPRGLKRKHIHPLARLVSVANIFCEYTIKGASGQSMSASDALLRMRDVHGGSLDPDFLAALERLIIDK